MLLGQGPRALLQQLLDGRCAVAGPDVIQHAHELWVALPEDLHHVHDLQCCHNVSALVDGASRLCILQCINMWAAADTQALLCTCYVAFRKQSNPHSHAAFQVLAGYTHSSAYNMVQALRQTLLPLSDVGCSCDLKCSLGLYATTATQLP